MAFESLTPRSSLQNPRRLDISNAFHNSAVNSRNVHALCGAANAIIVKISFLGSGGSLSVAFVVQPIRWELVPLSAARPHSRAWLTFQSQRGLSRNTLEAYSRGLEVFLRFLADQQLLISAVTRAQIGTYLATMQSDGGAISNATIQQRITVLRLFYSHLVDEGLCSKNPVLHDRGRALVRRYRRLPWIPNEEDWQAV